MGKNACWVPCTDHASIATEAKVVAKLAAEGISKNDLTREEFLKHAWDWTHKHGGIILEQLKKLGASCDWDRTCFTMDEKRSESVIKVFVDLYNKGLIYRDRKIVHWDPKAETTLSDEEVIYREENNKLYYLKYRIQFDSEDKYIVVATTRPETILGDTAVCVNPNDPRYTYLKGKQVIVPLINRPVNIIMDEYVDMEFGTGCLKVTPAHDANDYILGEKYHLNIIDVIENNGTINDNFIDGGNKENPITKDYIGKDRFEVRKMIIADLKKNDLIEKIDDYQNKVGYSERTDVVIEPKLSTQWFLKMKDLAGPALNAVENDTIKFHPAKFKNTYRHWMENIRDWNISRQLWWGHRIPVYYLPEGGFVVGETPEKALAEAQKKNPALKMEDLRQDEDCLDTWFSSWLWPISVFDGINNPDNEEINYYYPTNDLVTAPEIIFFWVARMIMAGYEYRGEACFHNVYFTGIVRDKQGRKMSKSLGNSPDPIELMEKYGADGVRMGMLLTSPAGNDLPFDEGLCEQGRNFNNKIWNAFRLVKGWEVSDSIEQPESAQIAIKWFENILAKTVAELDDLFGKYRLSEALMSLYKLFWDEFSSWYLEMVKPAYQQPIDRKTYEATLGYFDSLLRLLHPFMPFITEELWQALGERKANESIMVAAMPKERALDNNLIDTFEKVKETIAGVRTIRLQKNIPNKEELALEVVGNHNPAFDSVISKMGNLSSIKTVNEKDATAVSFLVGTTEFSVPLGNNIDVEAELKKLNDELVYLQGFLKSVATKLSNEKFVANAKPEIVDNERKKMADAESKINTIKESIANLSK
jgi:valyl-tRNA synthetase